jgi:hypothetical protein
MLDLYQRSGTLSGRTVSLRAAALLFRDTSELPTVRAELALLPRWYRPLAGRVATRSFGAPSAAKQCEDLQSSDNTLLRRRPFTLEVHQKTHLHSWQHSARAPLHEHRLKYYTEAQTARTLASCMCNLTL